MGSLSGSDRCVLYPKLPLPCSEQIFLLFLRLSENETNPDPQLYQLLLLLWRLRAPRCAGECQEDACRESWINDGICDLTCNVIACDFDGDDCLGPESDGFNASGQAPLSWSQSWSLTSIRPAMLFPVTGESPISDGLQLTGRVLFLLQAKQHCQIAIRSSVHIPGLETDPATKCATTKGASLTAAIALVIFCLLDPVRCSVPEQGITMLIYCAAS